MKYDINLPEVRNALQAYELLIALENPKESGNNWMTAGQIKEVRAHVIKQLGRIVRTSSVFWDDVI